MTLSAPEEMPAAFARAWMARDAGALAALFAEDADFVNVVGLWWEDRAAIARAHGYALRSFFADSRLAPGRVKIRRLGSELALVHCRFTLTGQRAPDGGVAGRRTTILLFVMQRNGDGWTCIAAQNTDIVPGAETHIAGPEGLAAGDYR
ncbi:SgcJ/EcaC family oxidoreductase [Psychromarinibacter sp. C21-152]|uniref:SgcJ/EcaC family oxidoreductase n=1 Tax=Psychromarinibacter sediminicola TaxID=3033385 RepID=A0AAE3NQA0_9RHOB|nr:SgcJ/EcaC family oxidoreductase [Psychromarinibacter sediminicola]MDF0600102.1 SgcJ/EcaC family oxidoreductase [Psychromarinibacter sediminicola]